MPGPTSHDILRNTATLKRWRAYSQKAYGPMQILTPMVIVFMSAPTPIVIFLFRHHRMAWGLGVEGIAMALVLGALAWAALWAQAYKKAHPFPLQP